MTSANVGKCQAVLCRNGKPLPLSRSYVMSCEEELKRIKRHKAIITEVRAFAPAGRRGLSLTRFRFQSCSPSESWTSGCPSADLPPRQSPLVLLLLFPFSSSTSPSPLLPHPGGSPRQVIRVFPVFPLLGFEAVPGQPWDCDHSQVLSSGCLPAPPQSCPWVAVLTPILPRRRTER